MALWASCKCDYRLSLPEDRQAEQQEGGNELFYKYQDVVRPSLVRSTVGRSTLIHVLAVSAQVANSWSCAIENSTDSAGSSGTPSYPPNNAKVFSHSVEIAGQAKKMADCKFIFQMEKANVLHIMLWTEVTNASQRSPRSME